MLSSVTAPRSWLMREPSKSSAKETELLFGHQFRIDKTQKSWAFGQAISPLEQDVEGYVGWVRRDDLCLKYAARTHYISNLKAPIFKKPDIKSRVKRLLPMGAQINTARVGEVFCELASGGFVHRKHLQPLGTYNDADFVVVAERYLGLPYVWGGVSSDGVDCSGLVQSAMRAVGRDCERDAGQQEQSLGAALSENAALQRGDLIFWPGHVAIMSCENLVLHANAFHMNVSQEPLVSAVARIGKPRRINRI